MGAKRKLRGDDDPVTLGDLWRILTAIDVDPGVHPNILRATRVALTELKAIFDGEQGVVLL